jgi:hypothetical protein
MKKYPLSELYNIHSCLEGTDGYEETSVYDADEADEVLAGAEDSFRQYEERIEKLERLLNDIGFAIVNDELDEGMALQAIDELLKGE